MDKGAITATTEAVQMYTTSLQRIHREKGAAPVRSDFQLSPQRLSMLEKTGPAVTKPRQRTVVPEAAPVRIVTDAERAAAEKTARRSEAKTKRRAEDDEFFREVKAAAVKPNPSSAPQPSPRSHADPLAQTMGGSVGTEPPPEDASTRATEQLIHRILGPRGPGTLRCRPGTQYDGTAVLESSEALMAERREREAIRASQRTLEQALVYVNSMQQNTKSAEVAGQFQEETLAQLHGAKARRVEARRVGATALRQLLKLHRIATPPPDGSLGPLGSGHGSGTLGDAPDPDLPTGPGRALVAMDAATAQPSPAHERSIGSSGGRLTPLDTAPRPHASPLHSPKGVASIMRGIDVPPTFGLPEAPALPRSTKDRRYYGRAASMAADPTLQREKDWDWTEALPCPIGSTSKVRPQQLLHPHEAPKPKLDDVQEILTVLRKEGVHAVKPTSAMTQVVCAQHVYGTPALRSKSHRAMLPALRREVPPQRVALFGLTPEQEDAARKAAAAKASGNASLATHTAGWAQRRTSTPSVGASRPRARRASGDKAADSLKNAQLVEAEPEQNVSATDGETPAKPESGAPSSPRPDQNPSEERRDAEPVDEKEAATEEAAAFEDSYRSEDYGEGAAAAPDGAEPKNNSEQAGAVPAGQGRGDSMEKPQGVADGDEGAEHPAADGTEAAVAEESDAYADEFDNPAATTSDIHGEAPPQETSPPRPAAAPAAAPEADEYDDEFEDHHADAAADDAAPEKRQAGTEADEKDEDVHDEYADEFEEHEVASTKPREVEAKEDAKREAAAETHDEYADEFEEPADAALEPKGEQPAVEDGHDDYADEFEATPATSPRTGPQPKSVEATAAAEEKEDEYADEFEATPAVSPDKKAAAAKTEEAHDDYDEEFDTPAVSPDKAKAPSKPQDAHDAEEEEVYDEEFDHSPAVSPKKSPRDVKPTAEADVDEEYGDEFDEEPVVDATAGATPSAAPGAGNAEPVGEPELDAHDEYDEEFDHDSPRQPTHPSGKEPGTVEDSTTTGQPPAAVDDHDEYSDEYHSDHEQPDPETFKKPDPAAGEPQPTGVKPQSEADTRTPEGDAAPAAVTPAEEHGDGEDEGELPANTTSEAFAEEHDAAHHSPAEALMDSVGSTAIHSSEPTEAGASDGARRASAFRDNFRAFAGGSEGHSPAMSPGMSPRALALALGPDGKPPPPRRTSVMPYEEPERRRRRESTKPAEEHPLDREAVLDAADDATDDGCLDTVGDTPRRPTAVSALAIGADGKLPPPRRTSIAPYEEPGRFRRQASMAGNMHPLEHGDVSDDSEGAAYEPTPHAAPAGVGALAIGNDGQLPAPRRTSIAPYEEPERRRRRHSTVPGDANPLADAGRVSPAPDCSVTSGPVGASRSQRRLRRQESVITILPHDEDTSTSARSPAESPPPPHDGDGGSGAGASATMSPPLSPSAARPSMSVMKNSMFNPLSSIHTTPAAPEALSRARVTSVSSFVADDVQETSSVGTHDDHNTAKATDDAPPIHDTTHPDAGRSEPKPHDAPMAEAVDNAEVESKSDGVVTDNHTAQGDQLGSDAKDDGGYSDDGFDTAEASPLQGKPVSGEAKKEATDEGRDVDAPSPDSDGEADDYDDGFDSPESPKKVSSSHTLPGSESGGGPETEENTAASPDMEAYDDSFDSPDSPKKVAPPVTEGTEPQEQVGGEGKHEKDSNGGEEPQGDDYGDEGFDSPDGSPTKDGHTVAPSSTGKDYTDQEDAPKTTSGSDEVPPGDAEPKTFNDSASSTNSAFAEAAKEVAIPLPSSSPTQEGSGTAPGCAALDPATLGPADVPSRFESGRTSRRSGDTSDTTPTVGASPSKGPGTARPGEDDAADAAPASRPASTLMDVLQRLATPARPTPIATPASTSAGADRSSSSHQQQQQQQQPPVVVTSATEAAETDDDDSDYDDDGFETPVGVNAADLESSTTSSAASSVASAGLQEDRLQPGSGRPPPAPTSERTTPLMPSSDGDVFTGRANRPRGSRGSSKSTPTLPASPEATDEAFLLAALLQQQRTASRQGSRQGSRQAPRSRQDGNVSVSVSGDNSGRPGEVPRNVGTPGGLGDGWGFGSGSVSFEDSARPGRRPTSRASRGDGSRTSTPQRGNVSGGNVWSDVTAGVSVEPPPALSAPLEDKKSKKEKKEKKDRHHDADVSASRGEKPDKIDKKDKDKERKREKKARRNPFGDDDGFAPIPAEGRRRRRGESNGDVFDL